MKPAKPTFREQLKQAHFTTEQEEAQWWESHQDALANEFETAAAAGQLTRGTAVRRGNTPTTTIRLDPDDILTARLQAERKGLRYQTYLKTLIHEALRLEEARTAPESR